MFGVERRDEFIFKLCELFFFVNDGKLITTNIMHDMTLYCSSSV